MKIEPSQPQNSFNDFLFIERTTNVRIVVCRTANLFVWVSACKHLQSHTKIMLTKNLKQKSQVTNRACNKQMYGSAINRLQDKCPLSKYQHTQTQTVCSNAFAQGWQFLYSYVNEANYTLRTITLAHIVRTYFLHLSFFFCSSFLCLSIFCLFFSSFCERIYRIVKRHCWPTVSE